MFEKLKTLLRPEKKSAGSIFTSVDVPFSIQDVFDTRRITPSRASAIYRRSSAVATAVDMISDEFSTITPVIYDRVAKEFLEEHPILDLLHAPNSAQSYSQFISELGHYFLLNGTSFIGYIGMVEMEAAQVWAVDNQEVSADASTFDQYPTVYYITQSPAAGSYRREGDLLWRFIENQRMKEIAIVTKFSSRVSKSYGDSPLEAAMLEARQQISSRTHNLSLIENGGRPSLAFVLKNTQQIEDDESLQKLKAGIREEFSGAPNAGNIAVLAADDMDLKELGATIKDMDFATLDSISTRAIYQRYKIPLALVTTDAATFNNYETALTAFYEQSVLPNLKMLLNGLGKPLLNRAGLDPQRYSLTFNPETVQPLKARRLTELERRKTLGVETINELRSEIPGREPVDGGDALYQSSTLVALGEDVSDDFDPTLGIDLDPQSLPADDEDEADGTE